MLDELKQKVCQANIELGQSGLVLYTWGNISGIDPERRRVVIKPSGVPYSELTPEKMSVVDLDGHHIDGLKPSSDTSTHLVLYEAWKSIGGICHTHSQFATVWAQACRDIPCFGTTHADTFYGAIPCAYPLSTAQIESDYEEETGLAIIERMNGIDPIAMPAILAANHGPFTWGNNPDTALHNAVILEEVARMAYHTLQLDPERGAIPQSLLNKHYQRKHGSSSTYGQG